MSEIRHAFIGVDPAGHGCIYVGILNADGSFGSADGKSPANYLDLHELERIASTLNQRKGWSQA